MVKYLFSPCYRPCLRDAAKCDMTEAVMLTDSVEILLSVTLQQSDGDPSNTKGTSRNQSGLHI